MITKEAIFALVDEGIRKEAEDFKEELLYVSGPKATRWLTPVVGFSAGAGLGALAGGYRAYRKQKIETEKKLTKKQRAIGVGKGALIGGLIGGGIGYSAGKILGPIPVYQVSGPREQRRMFERSLDSTRLTKAITPKSPEEKKKLVDAIHRMMGGRGQLGGTINVSPRQVFVAESMKDRGKFSEVIKHELIHARVPFLGSSEVFTHAVADPRSLRDVFALRPGRAGIELGLGALGGGIAYSALKKQPAKTKKRIPPRVGVVRPIRAFA